MSLCFIANLIFLFFAKSPDVHFRRYKMYVIHCSLFHIHLLVCVTLKTQSIFHTYFHTSCVKEKGPTQLE